MQPALHIRLPVLTLSAVLCATAAPQAGAEGPAPFSSGPQPGVENNFGFPLAFDPSKMDTSVDPRRLRAVRSRPVAGCRDDPRGLAYISGIV